MNEKNLKPVKSTDDAKAKGRKGGLASGRSRRRRKSMAKAMQEIMKTTVPSGEIRDRLKEAGLELDEDATTAAAFASCILLAAMQGNMQAARLVLELVGEDPQLEHKKENDAALLALKQKTLDAAHAIDPFYQPIQIVEPPPFNLTKLTDDELEAFGRLCRKVLPDASVSQMLGEEEP